MYLFPGKWKEAVLLLFFLRESISYVAVGEFQPMGGFFLGDTSPFFAGILLSRQPSELQGKQIWLLKRTMVEKNGKGIKP